jgi:hypothetical protein
MVGEATWVVIIEIHGVLSAVVGAPTAGSVDGSASRDSQRPWYFCQPTFVAG